MVSDLPTPGHQALNVRPLANRSHLLLSSTVGPPAAPGPPTDLFLMDLPRNSRPETVYGQFYRTDQSLQFEVRAPSLVCHRQYFTLDWRNDVLAEDNAGDL